MRSRIKPNGNISATHECSVICGPIGCAVDFLCRLIHLEIISLKKPLKIGLCNKADWHSRKVIAHRVSISMEVAFCIETLNEAIEKYGRPEVFNTDQGSQFTSDAFIEVLKSNDIQISMDGNLAQHRCS